MKRTSILLFCILFFSVVHAEKNEKPISISPALYKKFKKTETLISNKSYQQAEQKLKTMLTSVKQGSYEQAIVLRSLSSVYALKEQYKKAAEALSRCLNLKVLPESQEQQGLQNLGQLYMATEQYAKAIKTIEP